MKTDIPKTDTDELIAFTTAQFDTFNADKNKYLQKLVTCSEKIILYFLEIGDDRPYTNIKACVLYTTTKEGDFIHYLCVHSSYRSFGIGIFVMLILQAQLSFRGNKTRLHLQANNTTSAYR